MTRPAAVTGGVLLVLGLAVFLWKAVGLGMPVLPTDPLGLWQVELEINARGSGGRGSLRAALPSSDLSQTIFDERSVSDGLLFSIRSAGGQRTGVWSGTFSRTHQVLYTFRVQLAQTTVLLPKGAGQPPPPALRRDFGGPTAEFPTGAGEILARLDWLSLPPAEEAAARVAALYSFVADEVATEPNAGDDVLLTLSQREGSALGKARLLVTMLRAAGFPSRLASGLQLRDGLAPVQRVWAEAWLDGAWVPMSPSDAFFATRPQDLLLLREGGDVLVEATGVEAELHRFHALRERLRPEELATLMVPTNPLLAKVSLYRLPVPTQGALRILLVLPIGVLVTALYRNVIGIQTFGTFLPVLIALALRGTTLGRGLTMIAFVIVLGVIGRLALERLRLLLVPRLAILLCVVVLTVTGLALTGRALVERDLYAGVLFPMVILTGLIERFSIAMAEVGLREALLKAANSTLIAVTVYPLFISETLQHVMFTYPELVISIMGLLVWIGGYTGYRISDLRRFRTFAGAASGAR
ncbi:MAG TPA: UUP1 family membrane protein [Myxococcota bacterium]|jgi:hypothetical protein|nr:UUP1 family membrane protein [Myxococcota bacterium]